jgi:hypothetical protein
MPGAAECAQLARELRDDYVELADRIRALPLLLTGARRELLLVEPDLEGGLLFREI